MFLFYYAPALPPPLSESELPGGGIDEEFGSNFGEGIYESSQIRDITGVDPDSTGIVALNYLGIYPTIVPTLQPHNPQLWTPTWITTTETVSADQNENHIVPHLNNFEEQSLEDIVWYNQAGEYARVEWGRLSKEQPDLSDVGKKTLLRLGIKILRNRRRGSANNTWAFTDPTSGVTSAYWKDTNNTLLDYVQQKISSITLSTTARELNEIVSPAIGKVSILLNADDLNKIHTIKYTSFYGGLLSKYGTEFYFPATDTALPYDFDTGIQPGNTTLLSAEDGRCQIRVAASGVIIDEFDLADAETMTQQDYDNGDYEGRVAEQPDYGEFDFGFHLYDHSDISNYVPEINPENLLDVAEIIRRHAEDPSFADRLTVNTDARLRFDNSLTKLENVSASTSVEIGDSITLNTASSGFVVLDVANMTDAADDSAAATAGVPVGGLYKTGSTLKIRVS